MTKLLVITCMFVLMSLSAAAQQKLSREEQAKLTPDQRIAAENDRKHKKHPKEKDTVQKKVKRAKKQDRQNRKTKPPKHKKSSKPDH